MALGEELLDDYAFEITEARDKYEESIEWKHSLYENLKRGIWTNTRGDKIYLFEIDDTYFNNIVNWCKRRGMSSDIINEIISIRNNNFKTSGKFELNEYIVYRDKFSEYKTYKIVNFLREHVLVSDILGNIFEVGSDTLGEKYCSYKDSKFLWYWEIYDKGENVFSTLKDRYTYYDVLEYCKKNNYELEKPLVLLGCLLNTNSCGGL